MNLDKIFRKKSFRYSLLVVIIISFLLVLFTNATFNATKSSAHINTTKESFAVSESEIEDSIEAELFLYVESQPLDGNLDVKLKEFLSECSSDVKSFFNLDGGFDGPTVALRVLREQIDYTPFYSEAEIEVLFYYSSSGETSYFEKFVREKFGGPDVAVVFNSYDGPQKIVRGELVLRDTSYGVLTPKGYKNKLAEHIAKRISNEVSEVSV